MLLLFILIHFLCHTIVTCFTRIFTFNFHMQFNHGNFSVVIIVIGTARFFGINGECIL